MSGPITLDISRMLSRASRSAPTGIDRVEMAYAEGLLEREGDRLRFGAMHPIGRYALLPPDAAQAFVRMTSRRWAGAEDEAEPLIAAARRLRNAILLAEPWGGARRSTSASTYLNVSHHHLDRPAALRAAIRGPGDRFVCLVHDLIPIEFSEYARPNEAKRHARRIASAAALTDGVVVNSQATRRSLESHLRAAGRAPPVLVAPLGVRCPSRPAVATPPATFVLVGTIEPRKNHLLALHIWRRLGEAMGRAAPRLVLVGRRGWENENVLDMLDRCPGLRGLVEERSGLSDAALDELLASASALLLPSFAEGYGLPVAEALAQGVPVICSDLPALRECGADVPEYLDPLDGPGWMQAVLDYADPGSARRQAQLRRLDGWRAPSWADHLDAALGFIGQLADERFRLAG